MKESLQKRSGEDSSCDPNNYLLIHLLRGFGFGWLLKWRNFPCLKNESPLPFILPT